MPSSTQERIAQLTASMLRRKLYVIVSTPVAGQDRLVANLPAHLEYMIALEKKGVLFASGPFAEVDGSQRGAGMTIVRAGSVEEARAIAAADPFCVQGVRTFEVREWTVMEGSFGMTVNFSDQSVSVA